MSKHCHRQQGLTLVELMIAMTLGLVLTGGIIVSFISTKTVYLTQQGLSQIQDTGRLAIDFLEKDIRMAGYMGCGTRSTVMTITNTLNDSSDFEYDFGTAVEGYAAEDLPSSTLSHTPASDTDIIILRSANSDSVEVAKNNDSAQVFVTYTGVESNACSDNSNKVSGICAGDIVVVSDCSKARIFQATNVTKSGTTVNLVHSSSGTPGNAISSWGGSSINPDQTFEAGSEVIVPTTSAYFIATGASGNLSLWKNQNGSEFELLEGVENMAITYGEDTDATADFIPNSYKTAANVSDWDRVVSVHVELLTVSSDDNVLSDVQQYTFNGVTTTPTDKRLRQVFSNTVGIRSRLN